MSMAHDRHCDLALIHPPSLLNTKNYTIFPLPWNLSHIGSPVYIGRYPVGPGWDIAPHGFTIIKNYIENHSCYSVNTINLAQLNLRSKDIIKGLKYLKKEDKKLLIDFTNTKDESILSAVIDKLYPMHTESFIKNIKADLFAVDLHWLVYSQGAIHTLKLIKKHHPNSFTVIGGMTASYFKEEILVNFPVVDFLITGDGSVPLLNLLKQINGQHIFSKVPNLLYRDRGKIKSSKQLPLSDFKLIQNDNTLNIRSILTARGCPLQCITCGGSSYSSRKLCKYSKMNSFSIDSILRKILFLNKECKNKEPIFLIHDPILTLGKNNWEILVNEIKNSKLNIKLEIEFFIPHSKGDILNIAEKLPGTTIHISPESIDENVRSFHKNLKYSNADLIMNMDIINTTDALSMEVWFMSGLAKDSKQSISNTLSFINEYYKKIWDKENNAIKYNELLFIDPGSLAYDSPSKYGYKLLFKDFLSHMHSFMMPLFKYQINYSTNHLNRDHLFKLFLYMHNEMNRIYYENNIIDKKLYGRATLYNNLLNKYSPVYDKAIFKKDKVIREKQFTNIGISLRNELDR